jgi:serine/threonine protein kinase
MSKFMDNINRYQSIDEFFLEKTLGEGTFGKVFLGTHLSTGEKVIKLLT